MNERIHYAFESQKQGDALSSEQQGGDLQVCVITAVARSSSEHKCDAQVLPAALTSAAGEDWEVPRASTFSAGVTNASQNVQKGGGRWEGGGAERSTAGERGSRQGMAGALDSEEGGMAQRQGKEQSEILGDCHAPEGGEQLSVSHPADFKATVRVGDNRGARSVSTSGTFAPAKSVQKTSSGGAHQGNVGLVSTATGVASTGVPHTERRQGTHLGNVRALPAASQSVFHHHPVDQQRVHHQQQGMQQWVQQGAKQARRDQAWQELKAVAEQILKESMSPPGTRPEFYRGLKSAFWREKCDVRLICATCWASIPTGLAFQICKGSLI
jgi:hypothetical protein